MPVIHSKTLQQEQAVTIFLWFVNNEKRDTQVMCIHISSMYESITIPYFYHNKSSVIPSKQKPSFEDQHEHFDSVLLLNNLFQVHSIFLIIWINIHTAFKLQNNCVLDSKVIKITIQNL